MHREFLSTCQYIDHDAAAAITNVPLRGEVLVPGPEVLGIRRAGGRAVTPDPRIAGMQRAVSNNGNHLSQRVDRNVSAPNIGEILCGRAGLKPGHALKPGIRSDPIEAEQEPGAQDRAIQGLVRGRALQNVGEVQAEVGLLEHVEKTGHRPGRDEFGLERDQVRRLRLGVERRDRDPSVFLPLPSDPDELIGWHARIQGPERLAHFDLEIGEEAIGFERQLQCLIIRYALGLEIRREVLIGVAISVGTDDPDLFAAQLFAKGLQNADLIGDPVDALPPLSILLDNGFSPESAHDIVDRHYFLGGKGLEFRVSVTLQEIER
jgi:hypothetical protein